MFLSAAELAALDADTQRLGAFFRLESDPILRLWMGVGPIAVGINVRDTAGATYKGFGELIDVPSFQQLINGAAERIDFTLSGVSAEIVGLVAADNVTVKRKPCDLGFAVMDADWQMLGPVRWMRRGYADFLTAGRAPASDPSEQSVRSVTLSVGSLMTGRRRRGQSYWTDPDQQSRSPGDRFCERTPLYVESVQKIWPRF